MKAIAKIALVVLFVSILGASALSGTDATEMKTTETTYDGVYTAEIRNESENNLEFTDYSFKVYILLDGIQIPEDDPVYEKAEYKWKNAHGDDFTHGDGTKETERTLKIPSMTNYFKGKHILCEITLDEVTIDAVSDEIKINDQTGVCVMAGGKSLIGDGKMDVCGGTISVIGDTVTVKDVKVTDTKDTWSGIIGGMVVRYDSTSGSGINIVIEGTVSLESEFMISGEEFEYLSGAALLIDCRTNPEESVITLTGSGKLIAKGGQCAIMVGIFESLNSHLTIKGLNAELYVTNSTFAYRVTGCIFSCSSFDIVDSKIKAHSTSDWTISTHPIIKNLNISIVNSEVEVESHCPITDEGRVEINAISSTGNLLIDNSRIHVDYSSTGFKRFGIINCGQNHSIEIVNGSIVEITAESTSANICMIGVVGSTKLLVDNSTLNLRSHSEDRGFTSINNHEIKITNGSHVIIDSKSDGNTKNPAIFTYGFSFDNSSLDLRFDCATTDTQPAINATVVDVKVNNGCHFKIDSSVAAFGAYIGQESKEQGYIPGYEPKVFKITSSYQIDYSINVFSIKDTEVTYDVYEGMYDMSGEKPVPAKSIYIGEKAPEKSGTNYLYIGVLIAIIVVALGTGLYIMNKKKSV